MEAKDIISSGILELYVTGIASADEVKLVQQYAGAYSEVAAELVQIEESMEFYAKSFSVQPDASVTDKIFARINGEDATHHVKNAIGKDTPPDHIFCMSDEILIGAMRVLKNAPLKIPEDISVLAISNGFIPGLFNPEISYIETSGYELGKLAINRMLENMEEKTPIKAIMLPSRFVAGNSL